MNILRLSVATISSVKYHAITTLRPRQCGRHFADNIFRCIFLNENVWISLKISLKFVPKVRINNIPALAPIMGWCQPGDKPLSEPIMVSFLTHICITWPQRVTWTSTNLLWSRSFWPNLNKHFFSGKCIWKCLSSKGHPFCSCLMNLHDVRHHS